MFLQLLTIHVANVTCYTLFGLTFDQLLLSREFSFVLHFDKLIKCRYSQGLTAYVDSLYSTYLVVLIRLSYDDSIYLVIENMTYDQRFHMKVKRCQGVKNHVQRLNELELFIARILLTLGVLIILNLSKSPGVVTQKSKD